MKSSSQRSNTAKRFWTTILVLMIFISGFFAFAQSKPKKNLRQTVNGDLIYEAETLLSERGYWISKIDRQKDASTYHAIVAFQKVEGRKRTGVLNVAELEAIRLIARPQPKYTGAAHIEIDLTRQILFLVGDDGIVARILPVSSGSEESYFDEGKWQIAHTPRGEFQITRQIKGIRRAPLGTLYEPNYFYNGVAIHGSNSIPFKPASHGCVRIPRFASKEFSDLVSVGMKVYVFD